MRAAHPLDFSSPSLQSEVKSTTGQRNDGLPANSPSSGTLADQSEELLVQRTGQSQPSSLPADATEPLKPTNDFSIASLVLNSHQEQHKSSLEEHLKSVPFSARQLQHMGMGVLPVHQDFVEARQLANKLNNNNIDSRYKAAPSLSLENKSDQEDEDIDEDDDSMSIKVDEEEKDSYVSLHASFCTTYADLVHLYVNTLLDTCKQESEQHTPVPSTRHLYDPNMHPSQRHHPGDDFPKRKQRRYRTTFTSFQLGKRSILHSICTTFVLKKMTFTKYVF